MKNQKRIIVLISLILLLLLGFGFIGTVFTTGIVVGVFLVLLLLGILLYIFRTGKRKTGGTASGMNR